MKSANRWLLAAAVVGVVCAVCGWRAWRRRQISGIVSAALPAVPDLTGWPQTFASRVRVLTDVAVRLSDPVPALTELAGLYHANGRYRSAQMVELGLEKLQPQEPRWTVWLFDSSSNLGDMSAAQTWLQRAVELVPQDPVLRLMLADWEFKTGDASEAERNYRRRLVLEPGDPYSRLGLARIALRRGDRATALAQLERLTADSPDFPSAHNLLAVLYAATGERKRAAEQSRLGSKAGRFHEADDPWLEALDAWSFDPFVRQMQGVAVLRQRALLASVSVYRQAAHLSGNPAEAQAVLDDVYTDLGWKGDSIEAIDESDPMARGKRVYMTVCFACHQPDGQGVPGAFPPLAKSDFLQADRQRAIRVPLEGLNGAILVNGKTYNAIMPAQTQLSVAQLADVLTYVMNSWGNRLGLVRVDEVQRAQVEPPRRAHLLRANLRRTSAEALPGSPTQTH